MALIETILWSAYQRRSRLIESGEFYYSRGRRRMLLLGVIGVPLVACAMWCAGLFWPVLRERWQNSRQFTVAVARFENPLHPEDRQYRVTKYIIEGLESIADRYPGIHVVALDRFIESQDGRGIANKEARRIGARVVLWGDFYATTKAVVVSTNVEVLAFPELPHSLAPKVTDPPSDFVDFEHYSLQQRLSQRMVGLTLAILGTCKLASRDFDGAATVFADALDKPDSEFFDTSVIWLLQGTALNELRRYALAVESFDHAIRLDPRLAVAYNNRAFALRRQGRISDAVSDFSKALQLRPQYALAYSNRGYAYKSQKDFDKAMRDYDAAISLSPNDPRFLFNRAALFSDLLEFEAAISDFSTVIRLDSRAVDAYRFRGLAYRLSGKPDQAVNDYNKALNLSPNDSQLHLNRAVAYMSLGDRGAAMKDLDRALALQPNYAMAYGNRALLRLQTGEVDDGLTDANRFFSLVDRSDPQQVLVIGEIQKRIANIRQ